MWRGMEAPNSYRFGELNHAGFRPACLVEQPVCGAGIMWAGDFAGDRGSDWGFPFPISLVYEAFRGVKGPPGRTRTCNLRLRRPLHYPVVLRAAGAKYPTLRERGQA